MKPDGRRGSQRFTGLRLSEWRGGSADSRFKQVVSGGEESTRFHAASLALPGAPATREKTARKARPIRRLGASAYIETGFLALRLPGEQWTQDAPVRNSMLQCPTLAPGARCLNCDHAQAFARYQEGDSKRRRPGPMGSTEAKPASKRHHVRPSGFSERRWL